MAMPCQLAASMLRTATPPGMVIGVGFGSTASVIEMIPSCPPRFCPSAMAVPPGARKKVELPPPATVLAACGAGTTKGAGMATRLDSSVTLRTRSMTRTLTLAGGAIRFPTKKEKSWRSTSEAIAQYP